MQQKTVQILSIALFAALLAWGIYTTLVYLGVPVHIAVLLSGEGQNWVNGNCGGEAGDLCRGIFALPALISHTFGRAAPFLAYAILSLLAYLGVLGWQALKHKHLHMEWTLSPWKIFVGFLLSLWLIFTVLSYGRTGEVPFRRIFEPVPQIYVNVGEEGMLELKNNFARLQSGNCLRYMGQTQNGAAAYDLKGICVQKSFVTRVLSQVLVVLFFLFELLVLGRFLLRLLRIKPKRLLHETLFSAALGACGWIALLWLAAVLYIYVAALGWALIVGIPVLLWRHSRHWVQQFFRASWTVEVRWYDLSILLAWLLVSYFALNFLHVVRPFPIGWDDLGSYLNRPRLMVSYGHFVFSMAPFQWEYLTSLGFLLFGYDSFFGATASMMVNFTAGVLAVATVFTFTNTFLGRKTGLLSALLYYALPLVGHFSYADMKIDNAVFTMGSLALFTAFLALFPTADEETHVPSNKWFLLTGVFAGFALAIKPTSAMVILAAGALLVGGSLHWSAFVGAVLLGFLALSLYGVLTIGEILDRMGGMGSAAPFVQAFLALGGLAGIGFALYRDRQKIRPLSKSIGLFAIAFLVSIAPWLIHNNMLIGNVIPRFEMGAPNTLSPQIGPAMHRLPGDLALDMTDPACTPTGTKEELDRYWGFDGGFRHYLTLPWRVVMNTNATGYYVTTMPALLLFPLLLLLPYFWTKKGRWLRWSFLSTIFILVEWMFLANGIPWYGLGVFLGLVVGLEALVHKSPDLFNKTLASVLIGISLVVMFGNRFWQYDMQKNLFEYAFGKISGTTLRERTIPHYDDIADVLTEVHEQELAKGAEGRPYLFRVGTFIPYFIPRNLEVIGLADHQLDTFNCLFQERDRQLTLRRLKALGFSSIIFDTNTATIEQDQGGSLHKKVQAFVDFLNDPTMGWQVLINDPEAGVAFLLIP
ncbi:glycosyltransferase family 39 protein [Candidatus Peregrinibacteria bacterium]|nr:glycosyltransferase family 39 protein [Candidatus Peregrinibacteria bacterium]